MPSTVVAQVTDVFSREKRSQIMSSVKSTGNASTEIALVRLMRAAGISGWRRNVRLVGRPDFVFRGSRLALFVDGCFWHCCPLHGSVPKTNERFWEKKLGANKQRDVEVDKQLRARHWHTLRIWEHELRKPDVLTRKLKRALRLRNRISTRL